MEDVQPGGNRPSGYPVAVLRFEGDIASTSKDAVLGAYEGLPRETTKLILLDFTRVDYINSSGIALVIQLLIQAAHSGQTVFAFGLSAHFTKVFKNLDRRHQTKRRRAWRFLVFSRTGN